jgi:hypothetical protein
VQRFIPSESELKHLQEAATRLKKANWLFGIAKQESDAAKKALAGWLKENRKCDIETLAIGEFVSIEGVALIEIGKQNRFDEDAFVLAEPATHARFKKDFAVRKYKPCV